MDPATSTAGVWSERELGGQGVEYLRVMLNSTQGTYVCGVELSAPGLLNGECIYSAYAVRLQGSTPSLMLFLPLPSLSSIIDASFFLLPPSPSFLCPISFMICS